MSTTKESSARKEPTAAELIRKRWAEEQKYLLNDMGELAQSILGQRATPLGSATVLLVKVFTANCSFLAEIAAQLAEYNARETAAEVRCRAMKEFIDALQEQQQQQSSLVVPPPTKR
ncbi:MAG TPA: hypothetical protein VHA33_29340 [Candidatus Angelobacter sp.]|nr:hypothetical protein [Candidatus Angelobacter sp.]